MSQTGRVSSAKGTDTSASAAPAFSSVRNVVLVGHSGAGKTALSEMLLAAAGTIPRAGSVTAGTTVCDFDPAEHRQQRSVSLALAPLISGEVKINLIDTPGYADFVGELRAGLRAADAALFVVSAVEAIDGATRMLWHECATVDMPRAIVVTKLDQPRADFAATLASCQEAFGGGVLPLYMPEGAPGSLELTDLLHTERPELEAERSALIEGIIAESEDETLMESYLGGTPLDPKTLMSDLEKAVARGAFYPVLAASSADQIGAAELIEVMSGAFPAPDEHVMPPLTRPDGTPVADLPPADPDGPLVAEVIKTTTDAYVGRVSLVRVFSGTLTPDLPVHVCGHGLEERGHPDHDVDERIGALVSPLGKALRPLDNCRAGDICAVTKLAHAETGDTLSGREEPYLMTPWVMPEPLLPMAIAAHSKADEDKLSTTLGRLVAEDPTLNLRLDTETGQLVLWCLGEAHADVALDRLSSKYGVAVDQQDLRVALRETFSAPAAGTGRHVKQSGGHGQYAVCRIEVEPLPSGGGFEFVDKVVGGTVPRQFIPSVEKGLRAQLERGVRAGYPVVDIRVTLLDGKAHSVDSSDMAFQVAGGLALRDAAQAGTVSLLEPVLEVSILVDDEHVGAVMSDLATKRGRVMGTELVTSGSAGAPGRTLIRAEVPETELVRYAAELRSLSHGTGTFSRHYLRHEAVPAAKAAQLTS
ncbi:MAG TPA: elongation factor G-like protein EF-G2 [Frankiaceae bacterium]|jgi:elongation factor G|nr:elongation factor G-like protein EF-G2 [Frankiaceae bacterium]